LAIFLTSKIKAKRKKKKEKKNCL